MLTEAQVHKENGANDLTFACHADRQKWYPPRISIALFQEIFAPQKIVNDGIARNKQEEEISFEADAWTMYFFKRT